MRLAAEPIPAGLPRRALAAALARQGELRHAVRVSAAVGVAFSLGAILRLPQSYWMVFTAVIVVQTSIGGTITASLERLLGTAVGGLVGAGAAYLKAQTVLAEGLVLSGAIALLAFAAAVRPSLRVAPITAAIVLVGGNTPHADPLQTALWRVLEILLGGAIGVAATLLIFPARAGRTATLRVAQTCEQLAELIALYAGRLREPSAGEDEALHLAHQGTRKSLASVEQALTEAARERASGFRDSGIPDGLFRSLSRARSDVVMVGRALAEPLPAAAAAALAAPVAQLLDALALELREAAAALRDGTEPEPSRLDRPRAGFEAAVEQARQARITSDMSFDTAARVFGLVFALDSLIANLADLRERIADVAAGSPAAPVQPAAARAP
jgi:uncharacterized membrane protein YccC